MKDEGSRKKAGERGWRFWLGIALSVVSIFWLALTTDWVQTWAALTQANLGLVLAAIGLNLIAIPMRTARWRLMFPTNNLPRFGRLTAVMLIGQAINVIAPARAGDFVRASLVSTEKAAYVLGTLMVQTALDLLMLAGLVILLLFQVSLPAWWRGSGQALLLTATAVLLIVLVLILARRHVIRLLAAAVERWPRFGGHHLLTIATEFLRSLDTLERPGTAVFTFAWSILIWAVYGAVNYTLLAALGIQPSWLASFFVLVVLQLSIAVPSSPGRVGVFHYLGIQALAVFGIASTQAISFAITLHLISIVLPILIGGFLIWKMGIPRVGYQFGVED